MTYKPGDVVLRLDEHLKGLWGHKCIQYGIDPTSPQVVSEYYHAYECIRLEGMPAIRWQIQRFCKPTLRSLEELL